MQHDVDLKDVTINRGDLRHIGGRLVSSQGRRSGSTATELLSCDGVLEDTNIGASDSEAAEIISQLGKDVAEIIGVPLIVNQLVAKVGEGSRVATCHLWHSRQGIKFNEVFKLSLILGSRSVHVIDKLADERHIHLRNDFVDSTTELDWRRSTRARVYQVLGVAEVTHDDRVGGCLPGTFTEPIRSLLGHCIHQIAVARPLNLSGPDVVPSCGVHCKRTINRAICARENGLLKLMNAFHPSIQRHRCNSSQISILGYLKGFGNDGVTVRRVGKTANSTIDEHRLVSEGEAEDVVETTLTIPGGSICTETF